ncbi:MAG TPA: response regulator [Prolixibacteraceae bacterium]|nr:response regulator [Prolixibacteraceae bacterium]
MQNTKNPLIFVVEDNQIYNKLVVSYLKTNKYTNVESYLTGEEALQNMHKNPDLVIQDYLLDGITGIEVLIKAKKIAPHVEFIFLSGNDNIDIAINSMKYGASNYIVKDQMALPKLVEKIRQLGSVSEIVQTKKRFKIGVTLFFIGIGLLIAITLFIAIKYPRVFGM